MEEQSGFQKFLIKVVQFFKTLGERIKKSDRRSLIMIAAAVVLLIIILALIVHGVKANKAKNEPVSVAPSVVDEITTDAEPVTSVQAGKNSIGNYKVNTGSETGLNMRMAASSSSNVLVVIPNNTELTVLYVDDSGVSATNEYGWGYVEYNNNRGWVFMQYLTAE